MEKLFDLRQRMKQLYAKYDIYIMPVIKFLVMLSVLLLMNRNLGYQEVLTRWDVVLIVSLVCSLLPWSSMSFAAAVFTLGHLWALSWEAAVLCGAFLCIMALLQYLFLPGFSFVIVLIPAAYYLHIPYIVPLVLGLVCGGSSFIPAGSGVFMYYFLNVVQRNAAYLADNSQDLGKAEQILQHLTQLLGGLKGNNLLLVSILAFCVTVALVQGIRRLSSDYAPYAAVGVGAAANALVFMIGGILMNASVPYAEVIIGNLLALPAAVVVQFWILAVDYTRTEYLQFEDDDYVYFVKAVPKISVTRQERKVQEINSHTQDEDVQEALGMLSELDYEDR